jgi:hypothetical protein
MRGAPTMMDRSKRDSSTARADALAGAKAKKRRRLASVGMTAIFVQREARSEKREARSEKREAKGKRREARGEKREAKS